MPLIRRRGEMGRLFIDPACMHITSDEIRVRENIAQERNIRGHAFEPEFAQRSGKPSHRIAEL